MRAEKRGRIAVRLSTELRVALRLSAERVGLPEATQAMLLLRQALSRTMETQEYANRLQQARASRTRDEFLHDMNVAAEEMSGGPRAEQGSVPEGAAAQAAGPLPERGVGDRAGAAGRPGVEEEAQGGERWRRESK